MELLTVKEVAKRLKVNPNYVYNLMDKGHLNYVVLGSKKIIDSELERFLRETQGKDFSDLDNIKEIKFESKAMKLNIRKKFCLKESNKEFIEQLKFICN